MMQITLSHLSEIAIVGLVAMGVGILIGDQVLIALGLSGSFVPIVAVFAVIALMVAMLIGAGIPWMPALGAMLAASMLATALERPVFIARLTSPEMGPAFVLAIIQVVGAALAVVAGLGATVMNYQCRECAGQPG